MRNFVRSLTLMVALTIAMFTTGCAIKLIPPRLEISTPVVGIYQTGGTQHPGCPPGYTPCWLPDGRPGCDASGQQGGGQIVGQQQQQQWQQPQPQYQNQQQHSQLQPGEYQTNWGTHVVPQRPVLIGTPNGTVQACPIGKYPAGGQCLTSPTILSPARCGNWVGM